MSLLKFKYRKPQELVTRTLCFDTKRTHWPEVDIGARTNSSLGKDRRVTQHILFLFRVIINSTCRGLSRAHNSHKGVWPMVQKWYDAALTLTFVWYQSWRHHTRFPDKNSKVFLQFVIKGFKFSHSIILVNRPLMISAYNPTNFTQNKFLIDFSNLLF